MRMPLLALDVWAHRIRHYVGAYLAQLGGLDAVVFTAGVGENSAPLRSRALAGLEHLGVRVDPERNGAPDAHGAHHLARGRGRRRARRAHERGALDRAPGGGARRGRGPLTVG